MVDGLVFTVMVLGGLVVLLLCGTWIGERLIARDPDDPALKLPRRDLDQHD